MTRSETRGMIQTVLGPVSRSEFGPTTTHEHLYADFSFMLRPAQDSPSPERAEAPITLEHLGWIRRGPGDQMTDQRTLTYAQYARIVELLPPSSNHHKTPHRRVLEAWLYVLAQGCIWRGLPHEVQAGPVGWTGLRRAVVGQHNHPSACSRDLTGHVYQPGPARQLPGPATEVTCAGNSNLVFKNKDHTASWRCNTPSAQ